MSHEVYWGSHGCNLPEDHFGWCDCGCCECEPDHPYTGEANVACVATFPYYGENTRFYGDDAAPVQARLNAAFDFAAAYPSTLDGAVKKLRDWWDSVREMTQQP